MNHTGLTGIYRGAETDIGHSVLTSKLYRWPMQYTGPPKGRNQKKSLRLNPHKGVEKTGTKGRNCEMGNTNEKDWKCVRDRASAATEAVYEPALIKEHPGWFDENLEVLEKALNFKASAQARLLNPLTNSVQLKVTKRVLKNADGTLLQYEEAIANRCGGGNIITTYWTHRQLWFIKPLNYYLNFQSMRTLGDHRASAK